MRLTPAFSIRPMPRRWICALVSAVTVFVLALPPAASAATRMVATSGTDSGACLASACRSFGYAYRQAGAGDVVEVAGGSYGGQSIPVVSGRSGPPVEFRPQAGASVSLGGLDVGGSYVTVRDIRTGSVAIDAGDGGVTPVVGVSIINGAGKTMWIQTARDLLVKGGSFGGNTDGPTVQTGGTPASSNLVFDGVDFHDAVATNSTVHMECFWAGGIQGLTVRNSIFRNCAYFDIFFTTLNGPDPKDVVLENNVFEKTKQWSGQDAPYAINVANWLSKAENFTFRNNTFAGDVAIQPTTIVNMKLTGNVGAVASCKSGVSYSYNVWTAAKCSTTDKLAGTVFSQFVNPGAHDWRLTFGSIAVDAGNPNDYPPTDRAGLLRNGPPDAGAHEYNGIAPGGSDVQAPSVPGSVSASGGVEQVALGWQAASDNVGVVRYNVHRSTVSGFTPSDSNRVAQPAGAGFTDTGLAPGTYYYKVTAEDAAGNVSGASAQVSAAAQAEQTPPSVSVTAPAAGATVSGTVSVSANASDNRGVAGVQFRLDGQSLGAEDTNAPYSTSWDTTAAATGGHTLTAVARDAAGNRTTSQGVSVTVERAPVPDGQAPSVPAGVSASGGVQQVALDWQPSSDDVGVVGYNLHRSTVSGFTPSDSNRIAQPAGTSFTDTGLAPGTYYYRVTAEDAAGNVSAASAQVSAVAEAEQTPPNVSVTAPSTGATVTGTVTVTASASDDTGVAGVQLKLDGQNLGAEDTSAPYSVGWDTAGVATGGHTLTAVARDAAGNRSTASDVSVSVQRKTSQGKSQGKKPHGTAPTLLDASLLNTTVPEDGIVELTLQAARGGRVIATVKRVGSTKRARRVGQITRRVKRGRNQVRVSTRGWRQGRYRLEVRVLAGRRLVSRRLRVRVAVMPGGAVRAARVRRWSAPTRPGRRDGTPRGVADGRGARVSGARPDTAAHGEQPRRRTPTASPAPSAGGVRGKAP